MRIKNFNKYCESISGTELVGHMGPNYGEPSFPSTISKSDTQVVYSEITDKIYSNDEYDQLYNNYLKSGGSPMNNSSFCRENLDTILLYLSNNEKKFESATKDIVKTYLLDFGNFISMNLSHVSQKAIDENAKIELNLMLSAFKNPIINGKNYFELIQDLNFIISKPKLLSSLISKIRDLLIYIEPRINKFVKDCDLKDNWLLKIKNFKTVYRQIVI